MSIKQEIKNTTSEIFDEATKIFSLGLMEEAPKSTKQIKDGSIDMIDGGIQVASGIFNSITFGLFDSDED